MDGWFRISSARVCSRLLLVRTEPPAGSGRPVRSVKVPPASSTITCRAAMSHSDTSGSQARSTAPSATIMCDQKSPKARVRHTVATRFMKDSNRPAADQFSMEANDM